MTMVNVPAIVFFYVLVAAGIYGVLATGIWLVGKLAGSPATKGFGSDLMAGTAGTFVGFTLLVIVWLASVPGDGVLGFSLFIALFLGVPLILLFPPIWAVLTLFLGD